MFVNANGEGVPNLYPVEYDDESIERSRDLAMLGMQKRGVPLRVIAKFFNVAAATVLNRIQGIPDKAKQHYAACL